MKSPFFEDSILKVVIMELTLDYQDIFKTLSGKYKLFDKRGDLFLDGQAHAQFQQGDSYISLMAKIKEPIPMCITLQAMSGDRLKADRTKRRRKKPKKNARPMQLFSQKSTSYSEYPLN